MNFANIRKLVNTTKEIDSKLKHHRDRNLIGNEINSCEVRKLDRSPINQVNISVNILTLLFATYI